MYSILCDFLHARGISAEPSMRSTDRKAVTERIAQRGRDYKLVAYTGAGELVIVSSDTIMSNTGTQQDTISTHARDVKGRLCLPIVWLLQGLWINRATTNTPLMPSPGPSTRAMCHGRRISVTKDPHSSAGCRPISADLVRGRVSPVSLASITLLT